ncbi:putative transcriptional regulator XRE family [Brachyspira sp. CAG:484]|nr:putative transcriptional regulator XRE family [Brachyspira sp. CAG:484]
MIENRVAIYMAIKRLDKRDIVRMTGIDRHTLNNICKCKTKGIEFETLNKLCFALDCTLNDLFRYVPDENPPV